MIIIEPLGGLANRMRVIASGIWLKECLDTELIVIWNENYELNCPFDLLFEPIKCLRIERKQKKYNIVKSSNQPNIFKSLKAKFINKLAGVDYCIEESDFPLLVWKKKIDILEVAKRNKYLYIQTCQEFGDNAHIFKRFIPILNIRDRIQQTRLFFSHRTIGIHIRRTDNIPSITESPTVLFIAEMKRELNFKQTSFFVCSDDIDVKNQLIEIFAEKIITLKGETSRTNIKGIQDALVDLYCLGYTQKIYGCYYSSYCDIAARLSGIQLQVLKN